MSQIIELRELAAMAFANAEHALEAGELDKFQAFLDESKRHGERAKALEDAAAQVKAMRGDFNRPTNPVPLTSTEAAVYNPNDSGAKYSADYRPETWVKGFSPALQPQWVRDQMGDNLKAEARFYRDTFARWLRAKNRESLQMFLSSATPAELKAMQENTDNEGGYFVPEEYRTITIHDPGNPGGVHRPFCNVITTGLKDGYIPTLGSVTWAAIAEEAAYGDNTPTVGQVSFSVRKAGGAVKVASELLEDAAANIPALLSQIFNEARGRWEDQQIIEGDGTTEPEGLRTTLAAGQTYTLANATSVVAADIVGAYWTLPAQFRNGAIWSTSSLFMKQVQSIGATAAGIHFLGTNYPTGTLPPADTLMGKPLALFDGTGWDDAAAIATTEVLGAFGNFKHYYLIDRVGMSIRRDDSIYVANDQVGLFARARQDGRIGLVNAFRLLKAA